MKDLFDFLFLVEPEEGRSFARRFRKAGLASPMMYGEVGELGGGEISHQTKADLLLEFGIAALDRAVGRFDIIMDAAMARLKRADRLRTFSAVATAVLASGLVASLAAVPGSIWNIALGLLSLASSVASVVAGRLEGGEVSLVQNITSVAGKHEAARSLLQRLQMYAKNPALFDDVEARVEQAEPLIVFLREAEKMFGVSSDRAAFPV